VETFKATTVLVPIEGTSPLIVHRFSAKAKKQMLEAMQGVKRPKVAKDPVAEYEEAAYRLPDGGYGFPVLAFKKATVSGAGRIYGKSVKMTELRASLFFQGELNEDGDILARIDGEPHMQEDVVTVGMGGHDLRYRPVFNEWSTILKVTFTGLLDQDSLVSMIDAGGFGAGVGDWRPEKNGVNGTYRVSGPVTVVA
jgi:hypothetical protein